MAMPRSEDKRNAILSAATRVIAALFDRQIQFFTPDLGRKHNFTSAKAQAVLGWVPRPAATTIVDCAQSLIAASQN